jgi:hypothetical protein
MRPAGGDARTRAPPHATCEKAPASARSPTSIQSWMGIQHRAHRCPPRLQASTHRAQIASRGRTGERSARFRVAVRSPHRPQRNRARHSHIVTRLVEDMAQARAAFQRPTTHLPVSTSRKPVKLTESATPQSAGVSGTTWKAAAHPGM